MNFGMFRFLILCASIIAFAGAAIAIREAANWAWLIPAGLAGLAFYHLPGSPPAPPNA